MFGLYSLLLHLLCPTTLLAVPLVSHKNALEQTLESVFIRGGDNKYVYCVLWAVGTTLKVDEHSWSTKHYLQLKTVYVAPR